MHWHESSPGHWKIEFEAQKDGVQTRDVGHYMSSEDAKRAWEMFKNGSLLPNL